MLDDFWQFIRESISYWAEWATGGPIVMALAMASIFRGKYFRKNTWKIIFVFFLFMGVFSAWENQKQKRSQAELEAFNAKAIAEHRQRVMDRLQATINALNSTNRGLSQQPVNAVASNVSNATVIQGSNNTISSATNSLSSLFRDVNITGGECWIELWNY
jgi:hypothetical protein